MKVFKVLIAIILSIGLLCAQGVVMGILACNHSLSSESITETIQSEGFARQLYDEALQTSIMSSGQSQQAAQVLQKALQTDTVSEFIGEYAASSIDAILHGEDRKEITKEDLAQLTESSLDELSSKSGLPISKAQRRIIEGYINANAHAIVDGINENLPNITDTNIPGNAEAQAALARIQILLSTPVLTLLSVVCLVLGILLVMLFWRSKLGFAWWAAVSFLLGSAFFFLGNSSGLFNSYIQETGDGTAAVLLLSGMIRQGFTFAALCGFGLMAFLLVLCLVLRKVVPVRRRRHGRR